MANELEELLLGMAPRPNSVAQVGRALLAEASKADRDGLRDQIDSFIDQAQGLALRWMATGQTEDLDRLAVELRSLAAEPDLTLAALLQARLGFIVDLTETYLRRDNSARMIAKLGGRRRHNWRQTLLWIVKENRPIRVSDLVQWNVYQNDDAARAACKSLVILGLLAEETVGPKASTFTATWLGRSVAGVLRREFKECIDVDTALPALQREEETQVGAGCATYSLSTPAMRHRVDRPAVGA